MSKTWKDQIKLLPELIHDQTSTNYNMTGIMTSITFAFRQELRKGLNA